MASAPRATGQAVAANNRGDNLGNTTTLQKVFHDDEDILPRPFEYSGYPLRIGDVPLAWIMMLYGVVCGIAAAVQLRRQSRTAEAIAIAAGEVSRAPRRCGLATARQRAQALGADFEAHARSGFLPPQVEARVFR